MKRILSIFIMVCTLVANTHMTTHADTRNNDEMKGVWITSVYNQDWPSKSSINNVSKQKTEFINLLDDLKKLGFNTVVVQVRPKGDALYKSSINPWSEVLTGIQGKDPGYDPLSFMIEETHKRGMEFHAWFNPYRITTSGTDLSKLSNNHFAKQNPDTVMKYEWDNNGNRMSALSYNPGLPEVRKHIVDSISEVVRKYNVDAIHFDDYFYPTGDYNDDIAFNEYGNGMNRDDWRRGNINKLVQEVSKSIKNINPKIEFGISPRGIWKNSSSDSTGSDTNGGQSYYDIYCDTRAWIKGGWLDYVTPQLYWTIDNKAADYSKLVNWWSNEVKGTNTNLYIGQGIYKDEVASQIDTQINLNRKIENINGSMYFSYIDIKNDRQNIREKLSKLNNTASNIPTENPNQPADNGVVYTTHIQNIGWQDWKSNGGLSGTEGQSKRLESIQIKLNNILPEARINYRTHIQDIGWQAWKSNGESSGTTGKSKRLEAIQINLENAPGYKVEYRTHIENIGWQDWKSNGELSGTEGQSKRLEGIQIKIVEDINYNIKYSTHIENIGWQSWKSNGELSGTEGQSKRLEGIKVIIDGLPNNASLNYRTHIEDIGWQDWKSNGEFSGTEKEFKRLEAIEINLNNLQGYTIKYRVHIQDIGWQDWKNNGEIAGTTGQSKRIEAIEIKLIKQ